MAFLKRKRVTSPASPAGPGLARLHTMGSDDLYLLVETSLMNAQQRLAEHRHGHADRLDMLVSELDTASLGVTEMQARV